MNNNNLAVVGSLILGAFGVGYGVATQKKNKNLEDMYKEKVSEMLADTNIDIRQSLVDEVTEKHIESRIGYILDGNIHTACEKATREVENKIYKTISNAAEEAVNKTYKEMESDARITIERELRNIDTSKLEKELKSEAKERMEKKLDNSMDDILKTYNDKLNSISHIYESISKSITSRA